MDAIAETVSAVAGSAAASVLPLVFGLPMRLHEFPPMSEDCRKAHAEPPNPGTASRHRRRSAYRLENRNGF